MEISSRRRKGNPLAAVLPRTHASTTFNPEAPDFVPTMRMPSKRKASSSAESGATVDSSPRLPLATVEWPIIPKQDLFGKLSSVTKGTTASSDDSSVDDDEISDDDGIAQARFQSMLNNAMARQRARPDLRGAGDGRTRSSAVDLTQSPTRDPDEPPPRILSAMLVVPHSTMQQTTGDCLLPSDANDRLRYLPLCPAPQIPDHPGATDNCLTILPSHRKAILHSSQTANTTRSPWPPGSLPVELFNLITSHLARDDVKSMRLVCKEFELKVSRSLFYTSVVPFNTELYDMIDEDKKTSNRSRKSKGNDAVNLNAVSDEQAPTSPVLDPGFLNWQNAKEDKEGKVYKGHGLRVFRGFGPRIKRFGMSFEVSETQLGQPPSKNQMEHVDSYYGSYNWPSVEYARFANLDKLERAADETSRMKAAFSNLEIVQELALSIDNGLGWLNGRDRSIRARLFDRSSAVFGRPSDVTDHNTHATSKFWAALKHSQATFAPDVNLKEASLGYRPLYMGPSQLNGLSNTTYADTKHWPSISLDRLSKDVSKHTMPGVGVLCAMSRPPPELNIERCFLENANHLRKDQKEWLLETDWAMRAFLESYMLAIIDNHSVFGKVTTLNIAKLSSGFLPMLAREPLWNALPCLSTVILHVNPDWRTVGKDEAGFVETQCRTPSGAIHCFHTDILLDRVAVRESIKTLDVGWTSGGEHGEGMYARNNHILPAPITLREHSASNSTEATLCFRHVEHLTLSNCWITPPALEGLVEKHADLALKKLTLDSVSLTAHPKFPPTHAAGAQIIAMPVPHMQVFPPPGLPVPLGGWNAFPYQLAANQLPPNFGFPQPPAPPPNPPNGTNQHWTSGHRDGSWPALLDTISPGLTLQDYTLRPASARRESSPPPPRPHTTLQTLELKSCGYARLPNHPTFDQSIFDPEDPRGTGSADRVPLSPWFRARFEDLKPDMMAAPRERFFGQIVQRISQAEMNALHWAWGLREGWEDKERADEAEFDGCWPGGTGRLSGVIERGMQHVVPPS